MIAETTGHGESSSGSRCTTASSEAPEQSVRCESGLLTVESKLSPNARSVRLMLSDGRRITSAAVVVPARLGGPFGVYYQAVLGPSPLPVLLTELDANGKTLRVLKLAPVVECTRHPVKYVFGGVVRLVDEAIPQGPSFAIVGERYRFLGRPYFQLKVEVAEDGGGGESGSGGASVFVPLTSSGCHPSPYEIIYGVLSAPEDEVLVLSAGKLTALRKLAIAAPLHAGGVLAYGGFSVSPTELLVRNAAGKTVFRESRIDAPSHEECEAEG